MTVKKRPSLVPQFNLHMKYVCNNWTYMKFPNYFVGEKRFECPMCSFNCSSSFSLQEHVELHLDAGAGGNMFIPSCNMIPSLDPFKCIFFPFCLMNLYDQMYTQLMTMVCLCCSSESWLRPEAGQKASAGGGAEEEGGGVSAGERGV